ncbi:hypothetical protein PREVCOP_04768 [Segatella copri DSM 18205]|jgi:hypothetical protein|uniref:Uncharacterized protein n=1 Tax=Segatella copri DSM 18205 TaxID=537011 RepID=D1PC37_9BACT|nr:hypothetical protein PREVCOP_04768 [Segatella copri DSM 18205]
MGYLYILKLLCTFAIELRNMFNQLDFLAMQEDLENEIERKKKEIEKRLDYLLDDLSRLMKNRK